MDEFNFFLLVGLFDRRQDFLIVLLEDENADYLGFGDESRPAGFVIDNPQFAERRPHAAQSDCLPIIASLLSHQNTLESVLGSNVGVQNNIFVDEAK